MHSHTGKQLCLWAGFKTRTHIYEFRANSPSNRVHLLPFLNRDDKDKIGTRGAQIGLFGRPKARS